MADGKIELELTLEDGTIVKALTNVEAKAKTTGDKIEQSWASAFKTGLAVKAVDLVSNAFSRLGTAAINAFKDSIKAGIESENAIAKFNASLRAAGFLSTETSNRFQKMALDLQAVTKYTDEQILSFTSLSLNYARTTDEAEKLTKAAIELSAATGKDVETSIQTLGATLQGSIGKLAKMEGGFNTLTSAQLKSGAALDLVLKRLNGLAAAEVNTFSGAIAQVGKQFGEMSEAIGKAVIQSPKLKAFIDTILKSVTAFTASLDPKAIQEFTSMAISSFINIASSLATYVFPIIEKLINYQIALRKIVFFIWEEIATFIQEKASKALAFVDPLITKAKEFLGVAATEIGTAVGSLVPKAILDAAAGINETPVSDAARSFIERAKFAIDGASVTLRESARGAGSKINDGLKEGLAPISVSFGDVKTAFFDTANQMKVGADELAKTFQNSLVNGIGGAFSALGAGFASGKNGFKEFGKSVLKTIGQLAMMIGNFFILVGTALTATTILFGLSGGTAIAAGIGLNILGGALTALAGGGGGGPAASIGGGVASSGAGGGGTLSTPDAPEIQDRGTQLVVNVQGSIFDSDETGLRISDIIKTNFDRKDVRFA